MTRRAGGFFFLAMKDAFWFQHDSNARTDARILELRAEMGWEGYGLWWALVEKLREATDYQLSNTIIGGLAMDLSLSKADARKFLDLCIAVGLLTVEGDCFCAPALRRRMERWDTKRSALSEAGKRGAGKRWAGDKPSDGHPNGQAIPTPMAGPIAITEEKRREEISASNDAPPAAPSPALASPVQAEKPPKPRRPAVRPDEAAVFTITGFRAFVKTIGFAAVDAGYYLPLVQRAAEKTGEQRPGDGPGKTWEDFVEWYFKNERKYDRVVYPMVPGQAAGYNGPNPNLQLTTSSTSYSPEAIAARNVVKY